MGKQEYLYYAFRNKCMEIQELKNIVQNDLDKFPLNQDQVDEWRLLTDKDLKDLDSIIQDILLLLKEKGYDVDKPLDILKIKE